MKLKTFIISLALLISGQALAFSKDYIPAFKPVKKNKSLAEFHNNMKQELFQIRSLMNFKENKMIGFVKKEKSNQVKRSPSKTNLSATFSNL